MTCRHGGSKRNRRRAEAINISEAASNTSFVRGSAPSAERKDDYERQSIGLNDGLSAMAHVRFGSIPACRNVVAKGGESQYRSESLAL